MPIRYSNISKEKGGAFSPAMVRIRNGYFTGYWKDNQIQARVWIHYFLYLVKKKSFLGNAGKRCLARAIDTQNKYIKQLNNQG